MSANDRIANVGAAVRASDFQAIADVAALADDRALEIVFTPGAAQKVIVPLSETLEAGASIDAGLLAIGHDTDGTLANGKVRVRPAHFVAGVLSDPNTIQLAGKLDANLDSAVFGNNSSGSTRYDLLYATISYGAAVTATVRQKPTSGGAPVSVSLTIETDMTVTLGIAANAGNVTPLASLPADSGSGKTSVFNFPVALVALANLFAGGAINQSSITQLWQGGFIRNRRIEGLRPGNGYLTSAAENPYAAGGLNAIVTGAGTGNGFATGRWGKLFPLFAHFKLKNSTSATSSSGYPIDSAIDWRNRIIWGFVSYMGSAATAIESVGAGVIGQGNLVALPIVISGANGFSGWSMTYNGGANAVNFAVDSNGILRMYRTVNPIDGTNGDLFIATFYATDKLLTNG